LAIIGLVFILVGFGGSVEHRNTEAGIVVGAIFLIIYWFYRPSLLLVKSSRESLGGAPISTEEAEKFVGELTKLLNRDNS